MNSVRGEAARWAAVVALTFLILMTSGVGVAEAIPIPIALDVTPDVLGAEWFESTTGGFFPTWSLSPLVPHEVRISLSDGHVDVFEMTLDPFSQVLIPIQFVMASFAPTLGALGTLEALGSSSLFVSGPVPGPVELLSLDTFVLYDPLWYRYTLGEDIYILPKGFRAETPVPEPSILALTFLGLAGLHFLRRPRV